MELEKQNKTKTILNEVTQTQKDRYSTHSLLSGYFP